ncbi:MAG: hypothetical protein OEZ41_12140 [Nitrospirota bacterium]|nr:hypothetical protein [Nitrospirota bacterium]MDH5700699.1 hypothetical protein [Nitrospirota bacterium]
MENEVEGVLRELADWWAERDPSLPSLISRLAAELVGETGGLLTCTLSKDRVLLLMKIIISIIILHSVPGFLFMLFTFSMRDEYYFVGYLGMSIAFLLASMVFGFFNAVRLQRGVERATSVLFVSIMTSWILALLVLGVLNLTPLCVGQDNGDGINDIGDCVFYAVLNGGVFSLAILGLAALVAFLGGVIIRRLSRNAGEQLAAPD